MSKNKNALPISSTLNPPDALRQDVTLFDDKLRDLEVKQTQLECAILQERLMRIRAIQRHRAAVDGGRELARLADQVVAPAGREARRLAEECGTLEVVVSELKARYDGLCKTERRQEARFRGEFADLKQPMVEHLIRHYRKRPRTGRPLTTTTSVTYLTEVARCVACGERSEILPRECLDFLGAVDALDAMPGNLPPKINADRWRTMCRLRRAKIEVETKVGKRARRASATLRIIRWKKKLRARFRFIKFIYVYIYRVCVRFSPIVIAGIHD